MHHSRVHTLLNLLVWNIVREFSKVVIFINDIKENMKLLEREYDGNGGSLRE